MSPGPGSPFSIGSGSRSAITTLAWQAWQAYLGRMCSSTIKRRGDVFELLADFLAEASPIDAAVGAEALFGRDIVHDPPAWQTRRQGLAAVAFSLGRIRGGVGARTGSGPRRVVGRGLGLRRISWAKSKSWRGRSSRPSFRTAGGGVVRAGAGALRSGGSAGGTASRAARG